jgi:integrase
MKAAEARRRTLTGRSPLFCTRPPGEGVHPHGVRLGWALSQVESRTSLPVIQQLLGHSSLAATATYVSHIAPAAAVAEANRRTIQLSVEP